MEIAFRIIEIIVSLLAVIAVVFGWIIPYKQSIKAEKIRKENDRIAEQKRWKKELIDKQISLLYGPLDQIIRESKIMFNLILYQLGRNYIIGKDQKFEDLPENERKIWMHYVDTYKIPNQMKMVEIIRNNIHLMFDSVVPPCVNIFLEYALGWELLDNQSRNGVPNFYEYHYSYNYPKIFDSYIQDTLSILLQEQAKLTKE